MLLPPDQTLPRAVVHAIGQTTYLRFEGFLFASVWRQEHCRVCSRMKKRKPKRKRSSPARRPSRADAFRKQLKRWKTEGQKLQKQYDKLKTRGEIQHIEMFELGFEPLLVEIVPINVDHFPSATPGPNDPA